MIILNALSLDIDLLLARHFDQNIFGLGLSRTFLEGVIRADMTLTELDSGSKKITAVLNYDSSWTLLGYNVYAFLEYFRKRNWNKRISVR